MLVWFVIAYKLAFQEPDWLRLLILLLIIVPCAVGVGAFVWRGISSPETVVTLAPDGLHHAWWSREPIPWSKITSISKYTVPYTFPYEQNLIYVKVEPAYQQQLALHTIQRWLKILSRSDGVLGIGTQALAIDFDYLHDQLVRYHRVHSGEGGIASPPS